MEGLYHRLVIVSAATGFLFACWLAIYSLCKTKGCKKCFKDKDGTASGSKVVKAGKEEKNKYVFRERNDLVVKASKPEDGNENNVYRQEQQSQATAHMQSASKLVPPLNPVAAEYNSNTHLNYEQPAREPANDNSGNLFGDAQRWQEYNTAQ